MPLVTLSPVFRRRCRAKNFTLRARNIDYYIPTSPTPEIIIAPWQRSTRFLFVSDFAPPNHADFASKIHAVPLFTRLTICRDSTHCGTEGGHELHYIFINLPSRLPRRYDILAAKKFAVSIPHYLLASITAILGKGGALPPL